MNAITTFIMNTVFFLVIFNTKSISVFSQNLPTQTIEKFFKTYENNDPIKAIEELYDNMKYSERIKDDIEKLKIQFAGMQSMVGEYHGYEHIANKSISNSFIIYTYLVKFDRQPVRFVFEFYKPQNEWMLHSFSYDDNLISELEEYLKLYNLKLD